MRKAVTFSPQRDHLSLVRGSLGSGGSDGAVELSDLLMELLNLGCSRLEGEIAGFYVPSQCIPRGGHFERLLSRGLEFEPRLFENRAVGNVRLREFVSNLIENLHRVRSPKGKIGFLYPSDDVGSSLEVSPVEHVVPVLLREEVLDFDGSSVRSTGPPDAEIVSDSRKHSLPIAKELVVEDDRTGMTARVLLGFEHVS
jgi:hypothetical protein